MGSVSSSARTIRTETIGKTTVRLLQSPDGYAGVVIHGSKQPPVLHNEDPDVLWRRLLSAAGYDVLNTVSWKPPLDWVLWVPVRVAFAAHFLKFADRIAG